MLDTGCSMVDADTGSKDTGSRMQDEKLQTPTHPEGSRLEGARTASILHLESLHPAPASSISGTLASPV
jgi:hypothetical protein